LNDERKEGQETSGSCLLSITTDIWAKATGIQKFRFFKCLNLFVFTKKNEDADNSYHLINLIVNKPPPTIENCYFFRITKQLILYLEDETFVEYNKVRNCQKKKKQVILLGNKKF